MSDFLKYLDVYKFKTKLPGTGEEIEFKPITTGQMKKLLTYENEDSPDAIEEAIDELISESVITPNFDVKKLYLQDRFFLLFELRKRSKGVKYNFTWTCPKCQSQSVQVSDLDKIKIKKAKNLYGILKLDDNIAIELHTITREIQDEALRIVKNTNISSRKAVLEGTILTHALCITKIITPDKTIDNPSIEDKVLLIEAGPEHFYNKIRKWFDDNTFGVEFKYEMRCPHCGNKVIEEVPLDNFFFSIE